MKIRRLMAYLIDWYLITFFMNLLLAIFVINKEGTMITNLIPIGYFKGIEQFVVLGLLFVLEILYFCIIPTYLFKGQTIGKKILKIKVVNKDNSDVSFINLLKRDLIGTVFIEGSLLPLSNYIRNILIIYIGNTPVQYMVYIFTITTIVSLALAVFGKEQKMLHDYVGGTKVVLV